jgi:hypothetical protein
MLGTFCCMGSVSLTIETSARSLVPVLLHICMTRPITVEGRVQELSIHTGCRAAHTSWRSKKRRLVRHPRPNDQLHGDDDSMHHLSKWPGICQGSAELMAPMTMSKSVRCRGAQQSTPRWGPIYRHSAKEVWRIFDTQRQHVLNRCRLRNQSGAIALRFLYVDNKIQPKHLGSARHASRTFDGKFPLPSESFRSFKTIKQCEKYLLMAEESFKAKHKRC